MKKYLLLLPILALYAWSESRRLPEYHDNRTLWGAEVQKAPCVMRAQFQWFESLKTEGSTKASGQAFADWVESMRREDRCK